jgi:hypothetical protein
MLTLCDIEHRTLWRPAVGALSSKQGTFDKRAANSKQVKSVQSYIDSRAVTLWPITCVYGTCHKTLI